MRPLLEIGIGELEERIDQLLEHHPGGALVFDADGTLWTHDVGCVVFEAAFNQRALKPEARAMLAEEVLALGIAVAPADDSNDLARKLQEAFLRGDYSPKRAAEMQVWAYAGSTEAEVRALCRSALDAPMHQAGLHHELLSLAARARQRGARLFIVSASPRIVVEEAILGLTFASEDIAAGEPEWVDGVVAPSLAHPLPYGAVKASAGRTLLQHLSWVATFGDSGFDLEMMAEAHLAVGLGDKPELLAGLLAHPNSVRLTLRR